MRELYLCFEDVAQLNLVPAALFHAFIDRHRAPLAAAGVEGVDGPAALWAQRARMPIEVVDALHRIGSLADDGGVDTIVNAAGGPLFAGPLDRVPVVFALRTWLEHPGVFDRALGRRFAEPIRTFQEYACAGARRTLSDLELADLADGVKMALGGGDCHVHPWTERDGTGFYCVAYAGKPRVEWIDGQHRILAGPTTYDLVMHDARRQRLRVFSDDARISKVLVSEFALLLVGKGDAIRDPVRVSLEPLMGRRARCLEPTPGVLAAKVVEVEIASRSPGNEVTIVRGEDVLHRLSEPTTPIDHGPLRAARLKLRLRGERRPREVALRVPDSMAWDWRRGNTTIREFLEERGFLVAPAGGASWRAA